MILTARSTETESSYSSSNSALDGFLISLLINIFLWNEEQCAINMNHPENVVGYEQERVGVID